MIFYAGVNFFLAALNVYFGLKAGDGGYHVPSGEEESPGAGELSLPYAQAHVHQQSALQRRGAQGRAGAAGPR